MISSRIMPKLFGRANAIAASRQMSAVPGPPSVHVSFAERAILGTVMVVGISIIPAWVLVHIREYRGLA